MPVTKARQMQLPVPHHGQRRILLNRARYRVVACGRRFGKTETGKIEIVGRAVAGQTCWWLAPTYGIAAEVWRELKRAFDLLAGVDISNTEQRIETPTGGVIAVRSTHLPDNLRGAGLDFAVLDEAAFMEPGVWAEVVRPMLLERSGAALFLSTPYGHNWFWQVYQQGVDPTLKQWAAFHFSSMDNPLIPAAEFKQIRDETPERVFRSAYLAEFVEDAGQVFRRVTDAATAAPHPLPVSGRRYVAGVDWGRDGDYTAIAIIDADTGQMVALDRFNEIGWGLQRGRLAALCEHWQPGVIWAEANSIGSVNIEALQAEGLPVRPFTTTARSKGPLIEGLALALERDELALLPDPVLLGELSTYTIERTAGGGYRYTAPSGGHDDTVIATALAWYGVAQGSTTISFV